MQVKKIINIFFSPAWCLSALKLNPKTFIDAEKLDRVYAQL